MPSWLPHKQVSLGLDLQGGAHLLYQLDENEMLEDWLGNIRDDVRETLRKSRIPYVDLQQNTAGHSVSVKIREGGDYDKAYEELRKLSVPVGGTMGLSGARNLDISRSGDNAITLKITDAGLSQRMGSAIEASIETIRRRVDAFGTTEPSIQRQGRNRVLVQVPGISDVERLKKLIGETGKLEFKMVDPSGNPTEIAASKQVPVGDELLYSTTKPPVPYLIKQQTLVSGANLVDSQPGFDQRTGEPIVSFRFDATGAKRFAAVTQQNVGLPFAIILDGKVISAPVIREPILGGAGQISGNFTVPEASDLAVTLALRRAAGQAHRHRGAHRRREPRRRFHRRRQEGDAARPAARRAVHVRGLRPVRAVRQYRADHEYRHHLRRAVAHRLHPHSARHRRHRAHHRHRGRCQRADQRAHPRGDTLRQIAGCLDRGGLFAGDVDHRRFKRHDVDLDARSVLAWLRRGARFCRDAEHRHPRLDVHRRDRDAADGVLLAALGTPRCGPDLGI